MEPDDQARLASLYDALKKVQHDLSLPQLVALLAISCTPGLSVNDLAEQIGAPQQSTSRYVSVLAGRYSEPGASDTRPFINQEVKQDDPRSRALYLADRGRQVVQSILGLAESVEEVPHVGR